ncbi:hypothetical protein VNO78_21087 [Psophocarpus tetragonolobus]|uniref:F-box domain-containing protein n=1 Tax=Psophocarpus tetragonolobus TaxID=3891 RepID=A0AAN9SEK6_PSOTE
MHPAENGGAATTLSDIHPDVIQTHILNRLPGPALASAAATCSQLCTLTSHDPLWENACHATWPSTLSPRVRQVIRTFPNGARSFFADSFPSYRSRPASVIESRGDGNRERVVPVLAAENRRGGAEARGADGGGVSGGRGDVSGAGVEAPADVDYSGPRGASCGGRFEREGGGGGEALAERGGVCAVRYGGGGGGAVQRGGDVGDGDAGERVESSDGGRGRDADEWEREFGDYARGVGGREVEKEGEWRRV